MQRTAEELFISEGQYTVRTADYRNNATQYELEKRKLHFPKCQSYKYSNYAICSRAGNAVIKKNRPIYSLLNF